MSGTRSFLAVLRRLRRYPSLQLVIPFFLNVAILFGPPLAHSQNAQSPDPPTSLHGTVINSVTRDPIAHALVFSTDNRLAGFTDDQGRFEFQLPRSESTSSVSPGGQAFYSGSVQLDVRKPGFIESAIAAPVVRDGMTIRLTPESLIVGRVNLPSANQFDRITVQVYSRNVRDGRAFWSPVQGVSTRSNGEFRVANLAAGSYKIFTEELIDRDPTTFVPGGQLFGYPPVYYPAARDFASASALTLEAGKTVQVELNPVLQPYYPVKIALVNAEPGFAFNVSVALDGHQGPGYSLGDNGESSIEGMLPNGTYTVEAQVIGQTGSGSINITVKDAPLTHASMAIIPGGSIPVNIRDEQSEKSHQTIGSITYENFSREATADVLLHPAEEFDWTGPATLRPPRKPNDNDLVLENVRPGRYWLKVDPFNGYVTSATAGSVDLLRQPLVVGPGGTSPPIDIVLRDDFAAIDGVVEAMPGRSSPVQGDPSGRPMATTASAQVYCVPLPDSPGRFAAIPASSDGTFHFQRLAPGVYRVLAFDRQQNELEYRNPEAMSVYEDKGPVVRVGPGQTEQVRVNLISTKD